LRDYIINGSCLDGAAHQDLTRRTIWGIVLKVIAVPAAEVPDAKPLAVRVDDRLTLAVCRFEGAYFAFDNKCPHRGAALSGGELAGELLVCPVHHFKFSVKTGRCAMPRHLRLRSFPVREEGGELKIELEVEQDVPRAI
jgi:nitrite reductase/ring-hydroxylating ferredoxin subunit